LDVAGKVRERVEQSLKTESNGEFKALGLAGYEAVAAKAMFAGIGTGDVRWMMEGQCVHINAVPGRGEKAKVEFQVQLSIQKEPGVPTLGGPVLCGLDATHEWAGLQDQEAKVVEAANEHVQVLL
jgi:hypothetical protein